MNIKKELRRRRRYYQANKSDRDEYTRQWAKENPERKREIQREYRIRAAIEKRKYVDEIKNTNPCKDCGNFFHPVCMDFDHRPGTRKVDCVARLVDKSASLEAVKQEIAKCDLVCACCHRLRTFVRRINT